MMTWWQIIILIASILFIAYVLIKHWKLWLSIFLLILGIVFTIIEIPIDIILIPFRIISCPRNVEKSMTKMTRMYDKCFFEDSLKMSCYRHRKIIDLEKKINALKNKEKLKKAERELNEAKWLL